MLYELLRSDVTVKRYRCSDICEPLIELWRLINSDPARICQRYEELRSALRGRVKDLYFEIRERFNRTYDPCDFFHGFCGAVLESQPIRLLLNQFARQ